MQLTKFNPREEVVTIGDAKFTIRSVKAATLVSIQVSAGNGDFETAAMVAIRNGVTGVEGLTDADGKEIKSGKQLWSALYDAGPEASPIITELSTSVIEKSQIKEDTAKN